MAILIGDSRARKSPARAAGDEKITVEAQQLLWHVRQLRHSRNCSSQDIAKMSMQDAQPVSRTSRTQQSPLLRLPGDIRNIIWDLVFYRGDGFHVDFSAGQQRTCDRRSIFALSMTCRDLYHETKYAPLWLNDVHFHVPVLQDMSVLCSHRYQDSQPAHFIPRRRVIEIPYYGKLTCKETALRENAQEYVTLAMRLPHVEHIIARLYRVLAEPGILGALREVHVHLGFQTNNVFIERFYTAWNEIVPYLRILRRHAKVRISFQLRLSRKMVVHYDFRANDVEVMMADMDQCVVSEGEMSLPEMASVNSVRYKIWHGLFEVNEDGGKRVRAYSRRASSGGSPCLSRKMARCSKAVYRSV